MFYHLTWTLPISVADPGFPRGGGANSPGGGGAPTYDFAKFSQKLHEIERIWTRGGGGGAHPKFYYVDPPLHFVMWIKLTGLDILQVIAIAFQNTIHIK